MMAKHLVPRVLRTAMLCILVAMASERSYGAQQASFADVVEGVQPKVVKIYGSGGLQSLEAYQSGLLISAEGHVLTVWSYVLDAEEFITVVLDDGTHHGAKLLGHDPRLEIAVLKIESTGLPYFDLAEAVELRPGDRVLAFSNLFGIAVGDEAASVLHGHVAALNQLAARRGAFQSIYRGPVYVLDAMTNNPGAAGGVLTDRKGRLAGMLGKELRNSLDNTWLNFAIPISQLASAVEEILAGRNPPRRTDETARKPANAHTLVALGIVLVPDVLAKTPPFVDAVRPNSPAVASQLRPDDLILFVNDRMVSSCKELAEELSFIDHIDPVRLTVQRGQELIDVQLKSR
ncbi:MAG: S1C family serine protease [Pirellulaceae bacterium]